jgi:hypothetical protein
MIAAVWEDCVEGEGNPTHRALDRHYHLRAGQKVAERYALQETHGKAESGDEAMH